MNYQNCLLDPSQVAILIIDEQPQMFFGAEGCVRNEVINSVVGLAEAAKIFNIPVIYTTVEEKGFSGPLIPKLQGVFPDLVPIDRTTLNSWEDQNVRKAIDSTGKKKIIMAGLWTEVCLTLPTLSAISDGYEVYIVTDASCGASKMAHDMAIQRMIQAGAKPVTWQATLLEFQRDWANKSTYDAVTKLIMQYGGVYGLGIQYVNAMIPKK